MAKRYRMTPRRRAALKKAQAASARKRRRANFRAGAKVAGSIVGGIALSAATHHVNRALTNPRAFHQDVSDLSSFAKKKFGGGPRVDPNAPGVRTRSSKPLRYYGSKGRARHISRGVSGTRIRSR